MSGMLFSVIAIVMVMPVFFPIVKGAGAAPPNARASVRL